MSQFQAQKVPVVIASTLKPIEDVRAFEKLACSLGETNKYSLFIIGFSVKRPKSSPGFRFISSMSHFDSRLDRLLAQVRFLWRLVQIRPKILICCTYELLPIASIFKPLLGYRLVYDVQENYQANLDLNPDLSEKKKNKLGKVIQSLESVGGIDLYLLAEKCYTSEMPEKRPFVILENKYQGPIRDRKPFHFSEKKGYRFCITGTITPAFGVSEAIPWFQEILKNYPESQLEIMGHCPLESFAKDLEKAISGIPQISLRIDRAPIPHGELTDCLTRSEFSLLPYQLHPAISAKMPTKLYECAALGIPVLITPNPNWENFLASFSGGFSVDFSHRATAVLQFEKALGQSFFTSPPSEDILWKTVKADFQLAIQNLLS